MENTLSTPNEVANLKKMVNDLQEQMKAMSTKLNLDKDIFNSEEASAFLGITMSQLYKLTHFQQIPFYKPSGKLIMFERKELIAWVRKGRVMSTSELEDATQSKLQALAIG